MQNIELKFEKKIFFKCNILIKYHNPYFNYLETLPLVYIFFTHPNTSIYSPHLQN